MPVVSDDNQAQKRTVSTEVSTSRCLAQSNENADQQVQNQNNLTLNRNRGIYHILIFCLFSLIF